jgi:hypothetical protein
MSACLDILSTGRRTVASFIEAVGGIAVRREDGYFVATILEAYGCIDDKAFCSTDTQVWMEEDNVLGRRTPFVFCHGGGWRSIDLTYEVEVVCSHE